MTRHFLAHDFAPEPLQPGSTGGADEQDGSAAIPRVFSLRSARQAWTTIAGRIRIVSAFLVLLLVGLGAALAIGLYDLGRTNDRAMTLADASLVSAKLNSGIAEARYHAARFAVTGDDAEIDQAMASLTGARRQLAATASAQADMDVAATEQIEWLNVQVDGFENELEALRAAITAGGPSASGDALASAISMSGALLANEADKVAEQLQKRSVDASAAAKRRNALTFGVAITLILLCIMLALAGARTLVHNVAGALRDITRAMTRLAQGDSSIVIPSTARVDEIGEMARALAVFREAREQLAQVERTARIAQRQLLERLSVDFRSGLGEVVANVGAASDDLQSTARAMADGAEQAAAYVEGMTSAMREATGGVTAAAAASDQFSLSIEEIGRQAAQSAALSQQARYATEHADAVMTDLSGAARQIGQIVALIRSIAERTNMLALNASIEAARSGEAGRGFAVVAGEVKELARQTQEATDAVAVQITGMQRSTSVSVEALAGIARQICEVEISATAIAQAVDEQSLSSRELARNLDMTATGVDEIRHSLEHVRQMARSTGDAAAQVLDSANDLRAQSAGLNLRADDFLRSALAA